MSHPEHGIVRDFLDAVCLHVKAKELHPEIRDELSGHLAERTEELRAEGYAEMEAVAEAIRHMGSPQEIGGNLNRAHRPLPNWRMLIMLGLFVLVGLLAAVAVESANAAVIYEGLFFRKLVLTGVGLLVLAAVYFMDYRKLRKYSEFIFVGALGLVGVTLTSGTTLNGQIPVLQLGGLILPTMELSLLLLLVAAAGQEHRRGWSGSLASFLYRGVLPLILLGLSGSMMLMLMYLAGYLLLTWHADRSVKRLLYTGLSASVAAGFMLSRLDTFRMKLQVMLDASASGHYGAQMAEVIRSASWIGYGFASPGSSLPYIQSESVFPFLVYGFGWIAGVVIMLLVVLFLAEIVHMTFALKDGYAQRVTLVVAAFFALKMLWPVLMSFGLLPQVGIELPFIAYGGVGQVFCYAAAGLLLSMYRRKNMLPGVVK